MGRRVYLEIVQDVCSSSPLALTVISFQCRCISWSAVAEIMSGEVWGESRM